MHALVVYMYVRVISYVNARELLSVKGSHFFFFFFHSLMAVGKPAKTAKEEEEITSFYTTVHMKSLAYKYIHN